MTKPAIGTQVRIDGITKVSPFEVFNGRTGVVVAHPEGKFNFVTVRLTRPVNADDIAQAFGPDGSMEDITGDVNGADVDFLAKHVVYVPSTTYTSVIEFLAHNAAMVMELGGLPSAKALDVAAQASVRTAADARLRTGVYARETTAETIEEVLFYGAVALDVLDGGVTRPSVGNVRQAALDALAALVP